MNRNQQRWWVAIVAGVLSCAALAQDYRYQNPDDAARQNAQPMQQVQQVQPQVAPCSTCGTIDSIRTIEKPGEGSGVGMVAGGVVGGLLGHQIGRGSGNTAATIVGAAGGAYAGHQVEKNVRKVLHYDVSVRMHDGTLRTVSYDAEPGFRTGDKVRFVDGRLTRD